MGVPRCCSPWGQNPMFLQYHWGWGGCEGEGGKGERSGRGDPSTMWRDSMQLKGKRVKYLAECQSAPFSFFLFIFFFSSFFAANSPWKWEGMWGIPPLYIPARSHCVLAVAEQHCYSPMQPGKKQAPCPTRLMTGLGLSEQHPGFVNAGPRNLLIR